MRSYRVIPYLLVGAFALAGCEEDDPTGVEADDLEGDWTAQSITYTSIATPTKTFNAVSVGGALTLDITAQDADNATFTGVFDLPPAGLNDIPITGTIDLQGSNEADITFNWPPPLDQQPPITDFTADFTLSGNVLTFTRPSTMFAFPPSSTEEEARLVIVMNRS